MSCILIRETNVVIVLIMINNIIISQLAQVTVLALNFIVIAAIKEHFFENEIEKSLKGLRWSSYCHSLLTGLSPRPSKALSSTSSSVPTS